MRQEKKHKTRKENAPRRVSSEHSDTRQKKSTTMKAFSDEDLFGSDSDPDEAALLPAASPTASERRENEILASAACRAVLGRSPTASEFELYEEDPEGFEEAMMDDDSEEDEGDEDSEEEEEEEEDDAAAAADAAKVAKVAESAESAEAAEEAEEAEEAKEAEEAEEAEEAKEAEVAEEPKGDAELFELDKLPPKDLDSIRVQVARANGGAFQASESTMAPVQLPISHTDSSTSYIIIAARLVPTRERAEGHGRRGSSREELVMGHSMVDVCGRRCRVVTMLLVHAMSAAALGEVRRIFANPPSGVWLAVLDDPALPGLVLEPAHTLENVAIPTEAECRTYGQPQGSAGMSRGTAWLRALLAGASSGSVSGVGPLLSMKDALKHGRADAAEARRADRQAKEEAKKARVQARAEAAEAGAKAKAAEAKKAKAKAKADAKVSADAKAAAEGKEEEEAPKAEEEEAPKATADANKGEPTAAVGAPKATKTAKATADATKGEPTAAIPVGATCWYTPKGADSSEGRRRVEIDGVKDGLNGQRYVFKQRVGGQWKHRSASAEQLSVIHTPGAASEAPEVQDEAKAARKAARKAAKKAARNLENEGRAEAERKAAKEARKAEKAEAREAEKRAHRAARKATRKAARKAARRAALAVAPEGTQAAGANVSARKRKRNAGPQDQVQREIIEEQIAALNTEVVSIRDEEKRATRLGDLTRLRLQLAKLSR